MTLNRKLLAGIGCCLAVACGGGEGSADDIGSFGDGSSGGVGTDGTGTGGSGSGATGPGTGTGGAGTGGAETGTGGAATGTGGGGSYDCESARSEILKLVAAAQACSLGNPGNSCTGKIDTPCGCPTPVDNLESDKAKMALAAIGEFNEHSCTCTLLPSCAYWETASCDGGATGGICRGNTGM